MITVDIATEDELSESVALKLIDQVPGLEPGLLLRRGGSGYLRSRLRQFSEMARRQPVLLLTDLDSVPCPIALIGTWLGGTSPASGLLLRVAVRTIEAWLLADKEAIIALLGQRAAAGLPRDPDGVADPKSLLLRLATRAPRDVRLGNLPGAGCPGTPGTRLQCPIVQLCPQYLESGTRGLALGQPSPSDKPDTRTHRT